MAVLLSPFTHGLTALNIAVCAWPPEANIQSLDSHNMPQCPRRDTRGFWRHLPLKLCFTASLKTLWRCSEGMLLKMYLVSRLARQTAQRAHNRAQSRFIFPTWKFTVTVHCHCALLLYIVGTLYSVTVHCPCTLSLYTVPVHCPYTRCTVLWQRTLSLYTVTVHCHCTLSLYMSLHTVVVHCHCTLYTVL